MKIENVKKMRESTKGINRTLDDLEAFNTVAYGIEKCNEEYGSLDSFIDSITIEVKNASNDTSLNLTVNGDYVSEEVKQEAIKLIETMMASGYNKIDDNLKKESLKMMKLSEK